MTFDNNSLGGLKLNMSRIESNKKYDVINGWKGILALIIFSEHFGIMGLDGNDGYLAVTCFFIISGFLLSLSIEKYNAKDINPLIMTWKRMKSVYPCYLYGMFLMALYYFIFPYIIPNNSHIDVSISSIIGETLMLQKSGLFDKISINGADWYISAYIISTFVILVLVKLFKKKRLYLIPGIIISFIYIYHMFFYGNYDVEYVYFLDFFKIDGQVIKGIACMSIGMLVYYFIKYIDKNKFILNLLNSLEFIFVFVFFNLFFTNYQNHENILIIILMCVLIILAVEEKGVFSKILKLKPFQFLGDISMYLYLTHLFAGFVFCTYIEKLITYKEIVSLNLIFFVIIFAYYSKKILKYCVK